METKIYKIIDKNTNLQVGKDYAYNQRNRARARADKLDLAYGAYRYIIKAVNVTG